MRFTFMGMAIKLLCVTVIAGMCWFASAAWAEGPAPVPAAALPAASFDCGRAPGVDEQIICADARLRQADKALDAAYKAALAASDRPAHMAGIKSDEHSWIVERNSECQITKYTVVTDQTRLGYIDCFLDEYAERIADLEQMRLHPLVDPTSISHPIRKSFLAGTAASQGLPRAVVFSTVDIPSDGSQLPVFAWRQDGALLILAVRRNGEGLLSSWRPGNPKTLAHVPQAARFTRICVLEDGDAVLIGNAGDAIGVVGARDGYKALGWSKLTPIIQRGCGLDLTEKLVSDGRAAELDIGPRQLGALPAPRTVSLVTPAVTRPVSPAIRIDSRYHLRGAYLPETKRFVVSAADRLPEMQGVAERYWSKTNCLPYWLVSAETAEASAACVPFGPYVKAVPQPLPTKSAVFFAADGYGLYRINGDTASQVFSGTIERPVVSDDGCAIAFGVEPGAGMVASQGGTVVVLAACAAAKPAD